MARVKTQAWLDADLNGSRRRQAPSKGCRSISNTRPKSTNKTKKRRRDGSSPEKD